MKKRSKVTTKQFKARVQEVCDTLGGIDGMLVHFNLFKRAINSRCVQKQTLVRYIHGYNDQTLSKEFVSFINLCK